MASCGYESVGVERGSRCVTLLLPFGRSCGRHLWGNTMTYEAPSIQEVGSVSDLTLGQPLPVKFDDNSIFFWGSTPGSR